ncbi:CmpA/NrtA family ABC transporter substrate-binding protein [Porticoccus hydrocarbonoclasticus]|uniref:CmpA/NrtA family ABC transporter substrate-binding protein n=1 Tax=Porticoccus hydrocarbonoclasticus TaxID=1073414 RepID=UPI000559F92D|nr:CmpA/NrtA family ABC transporter substrate-binding protein [Porticoccus hydrocarbonoclasticus]|tara:strand:- start:3542 stop:5008 length:1467 start_codon:yes stop_codon:yes gene_type:complete
MATKSLGNPFDADTSLTHTNDCSCRLCQAESVNPGGLTDDQRLVLLEQQAEQGEGHRQSSEAGGVSFNSSEDLLDRAVESAIVRGVFGHNDTSRRNFIRLMGGGTLATVLGSMIPLEKVKAAVKESMGPLEKTKLKVGFVPITCATPIIMAQPMGFYAKYGLDVDVIKTAGWAVARDMSLNGEYDASHMLTPMPLAMSMGAGSTATPYIMPAVENINGQAIVLHNKHKDKRDPKQWKGFKFGVPFDYSMHNFLLRYYVAEHGLDPDQDIQIRVVPPPEMVANLRAGNLDGYLSPDPFNQRAVFEKIGFLHILTKDIWEGHPCCAFACSQKFATEMPNTYAALFRAIVDATHFSAKAENREEIARAISPKNYLNQPEVVVRQVLTGRYVDGLEEKIYDVPDRIDFDPFPWHSMAVWILTQMKRWGYISGDVDYKKIAEQVYVASETGKVMEELGYTPPATTYKKHIIMGKTFDYNEPEEYINSFAIKRV